jgi:hypothetical protein
MALTPRPAPPAVAPAGCSASITTTPPGARASVGNQILGTTPLADMPVPCTGTLVLEHPRYERVTQTLALTPGTPGALAETLVRPEALLVLSSTPIGATVSVNGLAAGRTPATVKVPGYTGATIEMSLAGHKPWQQKLYVKGRRQAVNVALEALVKPKGKGMKLLPAKPRASR